MSLRIESFAEMNGHGSSPEMSDDQKLLLEMLENKNRVIDWNNRAVEQCDSMINFVRKRVLRTECSHPVSTEIDLTYESELGDMLGTTGYQCVMCLKKKDFDHSEWYEEK